MSQSIDTTLQPPVWSADALQAATHGVWHGELSQAVTVQRIVSNTRNIQAGDAFLALKGERFDAHDFVQQAVDAGAVAVIVAHPIEGPAVPQLVVADTRLALGDLGAYHRQRFPQLNVVALTGSSGKTTVKEMLGSILRQIAPTLITRGNLNNDLGVPMMLLELQPAHQFAVMELGASHVGEIDYTSNMVQPQVAGVLNIGTAHMGEFGGRVGIAKAKSEIFAHLPPDGVAVVPAVGDYSAEVQQAASAFEQIKFGDHGDVSAHNIQLCADRSEFDLHTTQGKVHITLPFAGQHNIDNALAAASFALALGVELPVIASGLAQAENAKGRLNFKQYGRNLIIDDTYNANPHSMRAAAHVLAQQQGKKILVIGDIGELGDAAEKEHFTLGYDLSNMAVDVVIAVGEFAQYTQQGAASNGDSALVFYAFSHKVPSIIDKLRSLLVQYDSQPVSLLFKGSRYTQMESLITDLVEKI